MRENPLMEDLRRVRREYLAECGNDARRVFEDVRRRQAEHPERLVSFPSTPVTVKPTEHKKSA